MNLCVLNNPLISVKIILFFMWARESMLKYSADTCLLRNIGTLISLFPESENRVSESLWPYFNIFNIDFKSVLLFSSRISLYWKTYVNKIYVNKSDISRGKLSILSSFFLRFLLISIYKNKLYKLHILFQYKFNIFHSKYKAIQWHLL